MACIILTDTENERSIFFDTVTERPLNHEAFIGSDSRDQAEDFLSWIEGRKLNRDPRAYSVGSLERLLGEWHDLAFDPETEDFAGVAS